MKAIYQSTVFLLWALAGPIATTVNAQEIPSAGSETSLPDLQKAIDAAPDSLALHNAYLKASGFTKWGAKEDPAIIHQYEMWMEKHPGSATVPYALGHAYVNKESPKAKAYLLEAIKIDPELDIAYFDLWMDTERWGDFKKATAYIKKASELKPDDPNYAFYYASSFSKDKDRALYEKLSMEVVEKFPKSERGAQALYWLAARSLNRNNKIKYYELLKHKFSPSEYRWSSSGMSDYFYLLVLNAPDSALQLATAIESALTPGNPKKEWAEKVALANQMISVKALLLQNKTTESLALLDSAKIPWWLPAHSGVLRLRADILKASGNTGLAYERLLKAYALAPDGETKTQLLAFGKLLNKNAEQVTKEVAFCRDTAARPATDFSLNQYFDKGKASLALFRGKVVLLTYWFPGCGPCRGEFPHFQNVVNKFNKKDLAYVGINIVPGQNDYVVSFMQSSGYTFIPLEDYEGRNKGNLDNGGAAPMNFLLDQEGRIIFKNFRTDEENEDVLYEMIAAVIANKKKS